MTQIKLSGFILPLVMILTTVICFGKSIRFSDNFISLLSFNFYCPRTLWATFSVVLLFSSLLSNHMFPPLCLAQVANRRHDSSAVTNLFPQQIMSYISLVIFDCFLNWEILASRYIFIPRLFRFKGRWCKGKDADKEFYSFLSFGCLSC